MLIVFACVVTVYGYKHFTNVNLTYVKNEQQHNFESGDLELIKSDEISFDLDSLTAPENIGYYQYYNDKRHSSFLAFMNSDMDAIYCYDPHTFQKINIISLQEYGFEHNDKIQGFYFINTDSVFVYSYRNANLTLISISRGRLLSKNIMDVINLDRTGVYPYVSTRSPLLYDSKSAKIYMSGFYADEGGTIEVDRERRNIAAFDLKEGTVEYSVKYPSFYWGVNWGGGGGFRQSLFEIARNKIVISFMADHNLTLIDPVTNSEKIFYAGSKYFDLIGSMNYPSNLLSFLNEYKVYDYYCSQGSYAGVKYDSYNHVYYRIAELPMTKVDWSTGKTPQKRKSIIIIDSNLVKRGEVLMPLGKYDMNSMYISEDGLIVRNNSDANSNKLAFTIFKLIKKK